MRRHNALDRFVYGFQHRWETDRRFRATMSGAIGFLVILGLCSCVGVASGVTNAALASFGAARTSNAPSSGTQNTGTNAFTNPTSFPTNTIPAWAPPIFPAVSPIANSKTPEPTPLPSPTPTAPPSPTPCVTNCGGGGGGGGNDTATATWSPATWIAGKPASITIHTNQPNVGLVFIITYPGVGAVIDGTPYQTDGNGNYTYNVTVPAGTTTGTADVYLQANFTDGTQKFHFFPPCAP